MQPTYEELVYQIHLLSDQLKEVLAENQFLKAHYDALNEIQTLKADNDALKAEIKELKDKLNTNSKNSSKPPSQDPYRANKKKKSSGRKQGGQLGHPGHQRKLYPLEQVQESHDFKPGKCPDCQSLGFADGVISTEVRQVIELPDAPPQVTQYNIHTCQCSCCGKHVKANIPPEAQYGFGPRLMGFVTSLSGEFRLSKRQVTALVGKIGIRICSGSVCKIHERASEILTIPYAEIKEYTLQQPHLNADESSWKTLSEKRWLWIGHGKDSVFFEIKTSRSSLAFQEVFGTFKGGLTTDRYGGYNIHKGPQQLCWSHADRDFEKIASREGVDQWIGEALLNCKKIVFELWHQFKDGCITRAELIKAIEADPKENIRVILKAGAAHEDCMNKTKATCADFFTRFDALWVFVYVEGVEPTNNVAERGLRHGVIWRKLSHGSQSEIGERFVERVMTVAMTLKLQAKNTFDYFSQCFKAFIFGEKAPPLFSG